VQELGRALLVIGLAIALLGAVLVFGPVLPWLGRLPGDLRIERPGLRLLFPITTCLLLSAAITLLLHIWSRFR